MVWLGKLAYCFCLSRCRCCCTMPASIGCSSSLHAETDAQRMQMLLLLLLLLLLLMLLLLLLMLLLLLLLMLMLMLHVAVFSVTTLLQQRFAISTLWTYQACYEAYVDWGVTYYGWPVNQQDTLHLVLIPYHVTAVQALHINRAQSLCKAIPVPVSFLYNKYYMCTYMRL